MKINRSARTAWLIIGMVTLLSQMTGCNLLPNAVKGPDATQVAAATALAGADTSTPTQSPVPPTVTVTFTPYPTRTITLSPTVTLTRTPKPTLTVTPNKRETFLALTEQVAKTTCSRYPDTWQVTVERSTRGGWCLATGVKGSLYEYQTFYPSGWSVKAFGDLYPHLLFASGKPNIEIRLYQVFSYYTRKANYSLDDAPRLAAFYDLADKPFPVVDPLEKIIKSERKMTLSHDTMVLDSELGDQVIRRYFFFVVTKPGINGVKQLFYVQINTLKSLDPAIYQDLIDKAEMIMISVLPLSAQ